MVQLGVPQYVIWIVCTLLHFFIALIMLRRKLIRTFPVFFAYTSFHAISSVVSYIVLRVSHAFYFWLYWGSEGADALLTLAVIQELFRVSFFPYQALRRFGVTIFTWLTIGLCVVAVITPFIAPVTEINETMTVMFTLDRAAQIVELGLVFSLFVFCRMFGLTWRHYVFGIAAGLGTMTSAGLAVTTVRAWVGQSGNGWWVVAAPLGFTLGNLVFACYFASEKSVVPLRIVPRTEQLIAWNRALSHVVGE